MTGKQQLRTTVLCLVLEGEEGGGAGSCVPPESPRPQTLKVGSLEAVLGHLGSHYLQAVSRQLRMLHLWPPPGLLEQNLFSGVPGGSCGHLMSAAWDPAL